MMEAADDDSTPGAGYLWLMLHKSESSKCDFNQRNEPSQRFWFQITSFCLQWRQSPQVYQDESNRLLFTDITQVAPIASRFLRLSTLSSQMVLRAETNDDRRIWLQSLGDAVFCSGRPPGMNPIDLVYECIETGDNAYLRHLLSTNSSLVVYLDDDGNSLLLKACKSCASFDIVETLLHFGCDASLLNHEGESALLIVTATGDSNLVQLLVQTGQIDVNQKCSSGITSIHAASSTGQLHCLQLLLEYGGDVMEVDERGWSAMHYAAACAHGADTISWLIQVASCLVQWPAHHDGNTPLHVAARFGHEDIGHILLQTGASLHVENHDGNVPLQVAIAHDQTSFASMVQSLDYIAKSSQTYPDPSESQGGGAYEEATVEWSDPHCVWMQCTTPEGEIYYYNTLTFESSWHPPPTHEDNDDLSPLLASTSIDDMPLCMVPTICPLYEMDNPDVASKELLRRKKEREQRRSSRKSSNKKILME
ncbi:hypothetical protein Ae201684_012342 [Aphanomyces euteiches]|uniref:WW domain-containing protein n=1 Tax=Aphanomyces euteiches TaxID=100861 RepID=A0A6G0WSE2_9STRA|nr:hypothetical protein Ae201684_012342 [Aphanomyces euteiches]KAH9157241.1 hypothetical protein AeRB84_000916 [Aphanomyces euteiches]